jgi:hypothetical protein
MRCRVGVGNRHGNWRVSHGTTTRRCTVSQTQQSGQRMQSDQCAGESDQGRGR